MPPQDTLYLESDTASSLERLGTVRRSPMTQPKHFLPTAPASVAPDLVPGSTRSHPEAPSLTISSSSSSSSSSPSADFSRTHSLFSQGAILSNASSISQQSSDSDQCSSEEGSSILSPHEQFMCHDCVSPDVTLERYLSHHYHRYMGSTKSHRQLHESSQQHRSLSRHSQNKGKMKDKGGSQRSKSSHTLTNVGKTDSELLKSIFSDELALETINRQQKMLKRELAKQQKLAAELAEARRQTQLLLEEKAKFERLQSELPSKVEVNEMMIAQPRSKSKLLEKDEIETNSASKSKKETQHHSKKHKSHNHHHRHRSPSGSSSEDEIPKKKTQPRNQQKVDKESEDVSVKETDSSKPT